MTAMMREKLNLRLGAEVVRDIVLKAGRVDQTAAEVPDVVSAPRQLTSQQKSMIEEQSALITDQETRQAFVNLMQTSMEQQR